MEEIWKDINGYENKYQVSNLGNVRSLNYNNTGMIHNLKQNVNWTGLASVKLSKNNKTKDYMVARLVAQAFIYNPYNKPLVMHISNDILDNSVNNLRWAYAAEVKFLMYKKGSRKIGKASKNIISFQGKRFKSYSQMAEYFGIDKKSFFKRLNRGWSLKDALEMPLDRKIKLKVTKIDYYGKAYSIKDISRMNNIHEKLVYKRLGRNWNIYESAEIPISIHKKKNVKNDFLKVHIHRKRRCK